MDLSNHNIKELYTIARYLSIRYYKNFNKIELLEEINNRIENLSERELREFKRQPFYNVLYNEFNFADDIFEKPRKPRKQKNYEKCSCGNWINLAYKDLHLRNSKFHRNKDKKYEECSCGERIEKAYKSQHLRNSKFHRSTDDFDITDSAFDGDLYNKYHTNKDEQLSIQEYLDHVRKRVIAHLTNAITRKEKIHLNVKLDIKLEREDVTIDHGLILKSMNIYDAVDIKMTWDIIEISLMERFEEIELEGSGWNFREVIGMQLGISKFKPFRGVLT